MLRSRGGTDVAAGSDYVSFVERTIDELARAARRDLKGEPPPVSKQWAVPELTAAAVLLVALVISIAL
jgi:hypothetical protein